MTENLIKSIKRLTRKYFQSANQKPFEPGVSTISLASLSYDWHEVNEAIQSLLDKQVTMGEKVRTFEENFAKYIGVKNAIMVNSGSSANLLAIAVLANPFIKDHLKPGDEIITPAVTWATTVYPIINHRLMSVLVDVDLKTYNIDPRKIEEAISDRTRAIMLVHLLGCPCKMDEIIKIAKKNDLYIIEDSCEAHGAEYYSKKVGSFGDLSTFSFYVSHHITTIEGGMIITNNDDFAEILRGMRAFGWIRNLKNRDIIAKKYKKIDHRFLFINIGYNLRPTEIQAAFGLHQLKRLEREVAIRRCNAQYWTSFLSKYDSLIALPYEQKGCKHVYFGYSITVQPNAPFSTNKLVKFLNEKKIETRPIMAGNMAEQPVMKIIKHKISGELINSKYIMRNSFFFGNHSSIRIPQRDFIAKSILKFMKQFQ